MNSSNRVEIIDRDGWRKVFPLEKPLLYIGSEAGNDIQLHASRGGGVAPRHLQLIAVPGDSPGYRAINLGDTDILLGDAADRPMAPRSAIEVADGECFQVGDFALIFYVGGPPAAGARPTPSAQPTVTLASSASAATVVSAPEAPARAETVRPARARADRAPAPAAPGPVAGQQSSASIGLSLSLPTSAVDPEGPLEGVVTVRNLGREPGVQFRLELEGLEPDYYEMGSGPILFPNVEKGVFLRIHHPRGPGILAGRREIAISATAPDAYPGESVTVSQVLDILPFHSHQMRLVARD
jgi:hypothetical protein